MRCIALLAIPLLIASCAATPQVRELRVVQGWTLCVEPPDPEIYPWTGDNLCSAENIEVTVWNWIAAQRYKEAAKSCFACYRRQMGNNATGKAE